MQNQSSKVPPLDKSTMGISEGLPLEASAGGIEALRADIQRLMDLEAIRQTKHAYFRCVDTANWDELRDICHPDLQVHYLGGGYEYKLGSRDEFLEAMRRAFHSQAIARHNGHMPEIQLLSETQATGIWYLYDHFWSLNTRNLTHGTALYWDSYAKLNGRWVIRETSYRRIYQINEVVDTELKVASHYLRDHGMTLSS